MGSARGASRRGGDASKGKERASRRGSVRERAGASRLLSTPASIMGPRLLFVFSIVALCVLGLVMVYSSSSITAYNEFHNASYYFDRQALFLAVGAVACVALAALPYRFWANPAVFVTLWALSCLLLAVTAFGGGISSLGAERSISIGSFAIQPAEFAKITVLLTVASLVELFRSHAFEFKVFLGVTLVAVAVPMILIYRQPDLGTAIILAFGIMTMLLLAGVTWKLVFLLIGVGAAYVVFACVTQPYHMDRIIAMLDPWLDPLGNGYQSIQSLYAFGSGGVFGTGLGLSRQKYLYLPYAHTDFIFSVIGEELGLVGAVAVVALFGLFIYAGMRISRSAPDLFGCLVAGGMTAMIGFQACVNMAQACGVAPVTGKALPFISYGGSSLMATLMMCGIVISVSVRSKVGAAHERKRYNLLVYEGGRRASSRGESTRRETPRGADRAGAKRGADSRRTWQQSARSAKERSTKGRVIPLHAQQPPRRDASRKEPSQEHKGDYKYGQSIYARRRTHRGPDKR